MRRERERERERESHNFTRIFFLLVRRVNCDVGYRVLCISWMLYLIPIFYWQSGKNPTNQFYVLITSHIISAIHFRLFLGLLFWYHHLNKRESFIAIISTVAHTIYERNKAKSFSNSFVTGFVCFLFFFFVGLFIFFFHDWNLALENELKILTSVFTYEFFYQNPYFQ